MELYKFAILLGSTYIATIWLSVFRCSSILYEPIIAEYDITLSQVTWITGSYQLGLCISNGVAPACLKYINPRIIVMFLSILASALLLLSSYSTNIIFNIISLGFMPGICMGVSALVAIVAVPTCFKKYKTIAMQVQFIGCSVGSFFFCPGLQTFINMYTWRGALIILAGFYLQVAVCGALFKQSCYPKPSNKQNKIRKDENANNQIPNTYSKEHQLNEVPYIDDICEIRGFSIDTIKIEDTNNSIYKPKLTSDKRESTLQKILVKYYLHLFLDLRFILLGVTWVMFGTGYYTWSSYLVVFGTQGKNLQPMQAAILPSALSVGEIFSRILWGFVSTRLKKKHVMPTLAAIEVTGAAIYIITPLINGFYPLTIACGFIGLCLGGIDVMITLLFLTVLGEHSYGPSIGYSGIFSQAVGMGGLTLISAIIEASGIVASCFYVGSGCLLISSISLILLRLHLQRSNKFKS